jgi:hypothetical protein
MVISGFQKHQIIGQVWKKLNTFENIKMIYLLNITLTVDTNQQQDKLTS